MIKMHGLIAAGMVCLMGAGVCAAESTPSWLTDELSVKTNLPVVSTSCHDEQVKLAGWGEPPKPVYVQGKACVTHSEGVAMIVGAKDELTGGETTRYAIRLPGDEYFRYLDSTHGQSYALVGGGAVLVTVRNAATRFEPVLHVFRDPAKAVYASLSEPPVGTMEYSFDLAKDEGRHYTGVVASAISSDGRYLAGMSGGTGEMWLIDTVVNTFTRILLPRDGSGVDYATARVAAISTDGRYVYISGSEVITDTVDCIRWAQGMLMAACKVRAVAPVISAAIGRDYQASDAQFSKDGLRLQFVANKANWYETIAPVPVTLMLGNFSPPSDMGQLTYLALGDSYSSGEGDTERHPNSSLKYYRDNTDDNGIVTIDGFTGQVRPREKCHLSTRSYPYMLANGMDLGNPTTTDQTRWQSIACSGALTRDVKGQAATNYLGQGDRLKGYDYPNLKATALNEFIPGRQKQIEFVKKYKPEVITLTMGGNDLDFGGKIDKCVRTLRTCEYATVAWRAKMKNELIKQFDNLSSLYTELSNATEGKSKIYVLGYPVFINGNPYAKCTNIFNLDAAEREFINNSVIYMNNIIEQAAKKAGVKYIDIEHAFGSHRLCDTGSAHVTAITNVFGANSNEQQESFHPNHLGHKDMAIAVWDAVAGQSLLDHQVCSGVSVNVCPNGSVTASDAVVPPYFIKGIPSDSTEIFYYTLTNGTLVKMIQEYDVQAQAMVFKSESKVDITLYSDPTRLGHALAASDGSVSAKITISQSVPAGYHTLVLRGQSSDGTPVELYQTVEVRGPNPQDIDEDGIDDSVDQCAYISPISIDADRDGIDDACDPFVDVGLKDDPLPGVVAHPPTIAQAQPFGMQQGAEPEQLKFPSSSTAGEGSLLVGGSEKGHSSRLPQLSAISQMNTVQQDSSEARPVTRVVSLLPIGLMVAVVVRHITKRRV